MGYYCTVPQCTSLAGKTKNVKFHRFPRDTSMADKWNIILKRGKPYTKYSKVCSLHFTQADYNVTTMGQWKTLSKDAVPSQNLPKLNPDGTVMVIRKSRTVKYRDGKKDESDKSDKWQMPMSHHHPLPLAHTPEGPMGPEHDNSVLAYRLQTLGHMANNISPQHSLPHTIKPKKQDAIMQTDPVQNEDDDTQPNNSYSEVSEKSYSSEVEQYGYPKDTDFPMKEDESYPKDGNYSKDGNYHVKESYPKDGQYSKESYLKDGSYPKDGNYSKDATYPSKESYPKEVQYSKEGYPKDGPYTKDDYTKDSVYPKDGNYSKDGTYPKETYQNQKEPYKPKDYTKSSEDYIPQTNEEYNKEAEKYALERKSHTNGYDLKEIYQKQLLENGYPKIPDVYYDKTYPRDSNPYLYQNSYPDSAELLRNQQHNLQILQERHIQEEQHRMENPNFFNENHIKQEIDITDDDKYMYERTKEQLDANQYNERRRLLDHIQQQVKQEPDISNGCNNVMQPQGSPYYPPTSHNNMPGYYDPLSRPGPELLIAKQNALAAHTQLWQNTMKRPFYYSENPHYNGPQLLHRCEDLSRILQ